MYCCCDNDDGAANDDDDCVVTATCCVVVNDRPTRLPALLEVAAASNEGVAIVVVVTATARDGDCVTVDDRVTRPLTPDDRDAFDELLDCAGLSDITASYSRVTNKTTITIAHLCLTH